MDIQRLVTQGDGSRSARPRPDLKEVRTDRIQRRQQKGFLLTPTGLSLFSLHPNASGPAGAASPGRHHDHEKESHAASPQLGNLFSKIGLEIQNLSHRHPRRPHGPYSALQISCWGQGCNGATVDAPYLVCRIPAELSTCTHVCTRTLAHLQHPEDTGKHTDCAAWPGGPRRNSSFFLSAPLEELTFFQ